MEDKDTLTIKRSDLAAIVNGFNTVRMTLVTCAPKFAPGSVGGDAMRICVNADQLVAPAMAALNPPAKK